jgi:hypothetical protein
MAKNSSKTASILIINKKIKISPEGIFGGTGRFVFINDYCTFAGAENRIPLIWKKARVETKYLS